MVPNNYTLGVSISIPQGVVTPPPPDVLQKKAQEDEGWTLPNREKYIIWNGALPHYIFLDSLHQSEVGAD